MGDVLKTMGFSASRADANIWIKKTKDGNGYEYIATHVDDMIVVAKDPNTYITRMANHSLLKRSKKTHHTI